MGLIENGILAISRESKGLSVIPETEESTDDYLKRLILVEYIATPGSNISKAGIESVEKDLDLSPGTCKRWMSNKNFQALVAKRSREQATGGFGLAMAYNEMTRLISDPDTPAGVRAKVCADLAKLDLKRSEMYLNYKKGQSKEKNPDDKTMEELIEEADYEVIDG